MADPLPVVGSVPYAAKLRRVEEEGRKVIEAHMRAASHPAHTADLEYATWERRTAREAAEEERKVQEALLRGQTMRANAPAASARSARPARASARRGAR